MQGLKQYNCTIQCIAIYCNKYIVLLRLDIAIYYIVVPLQVV